MHENYEFNCHIARHKQCDAVISVMGSIMQVVRLCMVEVKIQYITT